ncbi:MAG TPA: RNA 2',3'-cyclic phosphodiesterase [Lentimicrobium sp.]|jgi:2'-5' RNA ligase|nr:RNA 2',3'-cyclic phosphodiesterase [Lentimicrobium sp.]
METKRLFAAIRIVPGENFADMYHNLRQVLGFHIIRWVEPENVHITLRFFGDTPVDEIPAIGEALRKASEGISPFNLLLARTGIFGSYYNPRVIWFGINEHPALVKLITNVNLELEQAGYISDRQNFVPHITVGRVKEIRDKNHFQEIIARFRDLKFQEQSVNGFSLYESILKKEGPEYKVIEEFPLL